LKVLVVGGGGREHALCWKIAQSPLLKKLYCAPGNGGIGEIAENVPINAEDLGGLLNFAKSEGIDLTVVGPEAPLVKGLVDLFEKEGLKVFGPNKLAAEIEGSKAFAKTFMKKYGIRTAPFEVFDDPQKAKRYVLESRRPLVVKASGLAAGKGTFVCESVEEALNAIEEIMVKKAFGEAGSKVVIEEKLEGFEVSYMVVSDGENVIPLSPSQDHKRLLDGDMGPNTGGMGAYSPVPFLTSELEERILKEIMIPTIRGLKEEGRPYRGLLYGGLMIDKEKNPWVLEFNCRFGDPETQPLMVRMEGDLLEIILCCLKGKLNQVRLQWSDQPAVCVVMAQKGYPGSYEKGKEIKGLEEAVRMKEVWVFHAGTIKRNGKFYTSGGRVLGVTARGKDFEEAIKRAYEAVEKISWEGVYYRKDIGKRALSCPSLS
jgi:phosphoribosylamine--glycine ligase